MVIFFLDLSTRNPCLVFLCVFYTLLYKAVFFFLWLSLVPLSYILVELIFYFGTAKIPDHILEKWVDYIFFCYFNCSLLRLWREDSSSNTTFSLLWGNQVWTRRYIKFQICINHGARILIWLLSYLPGKLSNPIEASHVDWTKSNTHQSAYYSQVVASKCVWERASTERSS